MTVGTIQAAQRQCPAWGGTCPNASTRNL